MSANSQLPTSKARGPDCAGRVHPSPESFPLRLRDRKFRVTVYVALAITASCAIAICAGQTKAQRMNVPDNADYSRFEHTSEYHARLPCLLCHRRESNAPRPPMPGRTNHLPCAGCHVKQFADTSNAICTICHTNPQAGTVKEFPRLKSFNMKFDHAGGHMTLGRGACAGCHRPARGGVAMTIPSGFNAHLICFQCHGPHAKSGERDMESCGICHQVGRYARVNQMAPAFKIGFSHQKHDGNERLACNDCHQVRAGLASNGITAPQPLNHHAARGALSCLSCHNGKRAFGGDDFSACKRCHDGATWHF